VPSAQRPRTSPRESRGRMGVIESFNVGATSSSPQDLLHTAEAQIVGAGTTILHHNTHLSMRFVDPGLVLRGMWQSRGTCCEGLGGRSVEGGAAEDLRAVPESC